MQRNDNRVLEFAHCYGEVPGCVLRLQILCYQDKSSNVVLKVLGVFISAALPDCGSCNVHSGV